MYTAVRFLMMNCAFLLGRLLMMISGISKEILVSDIYFEIGFEKISA